MTRYSYDAFGPLVKWSDPGSNDADTRYFLWQGDHVFAEVDSVSGDRVAEYSQYPGADNLHALTIGTSASQYYAHQDALGNMIALTIRAGTSSATTGGEVASVF